MKNRILLYRRIYCFPLLLLCFILSSCTPEKAKALRLGAVQFKSESLACIDSIDNMHKQEWEPPPRSTKKVREEFISNILISDSKNIFPEEIDFALDPYKVDLNSRINEDWQKFTSNITLQYSLFASIYDDLERGSFLAQESVAKSKEYASKLTIQMASFAQLIDQYPPVLLQYRTDIAAKLTDLKDQFQNEVSSEEFQEISTSEDFQQIITNEEFQQISVSASELMDQWQQVKIQEQTLKDKTVKQCLQAALMGKELIPLIDSYDQLDLDTINTIIAGIFDTVGSITGKDYSALKQQSSTLIAQIQEDVILKDAANKIFAEVSEAMKNRNDTPTSEPEISNDSQVIDIRNDNQIFTELSYLIEASNQKITSQIPSRQH